MTRHAGGSDALFPGTVDGRFSACDSLHSAHLRFGRGISESLVRSHNPKEVIPCLVRFLGFQKAASGPVSMTRRSTARTFGLRDPVSRRAAQAALFVCAPSAFDSSDLARPRAAVHGGSRTGVLGGPRAAGHAANVRGDPGRECARRPRTDVRFPHRVVGIRQNRRECSAAPFECRLRRAAIRLWESSACVPSTRVARKLLRPAEGLPSVPLDRSDQPMERTAVDLFLPENARTAVRRETLMTRSGSERCSATASLVQEDRRQLPGSV
jgi:hypothetical protein